LCRDGSMYEKGYVWCGICYQWIKRSDLKDGLRCPIHNQRVRIKGRMKRSKKALYNYQDE